VVVQVVNPSNFEGIDIHSSFVHVISPSTALVVTVIDVFVEET